jgi:hypothetical protein
MFVQVVQVSGWAVHRLRKAYYVFTLVKHSASEMLVGRKIIFELARVTPESQRLSRQTKDFRSLTGVQVFRHSTFLFYT